MATRGATSSARRTLELKREIAIRRIDECLQAAREARDDVDRLPVFLSRYGKLESYISNFEQHHFKICVEITDPDELEKQDQIRQELDNKYFEILELHSTLTVNTRASTNENSRTDSSVKLPRLDLPSFDGNIKNWSTFYDMFNTMVHQNRKLSNVERFSILISLLRNEPLQLVKGFPLTENNYLDAYNTLIDRYQCKRKLAFRHWDEIQNIKLNSNSPRELRRLVDTFKENIAVLKNLNLPVKNWDFPLFYLLINKIDQDTRRRFELQNEVKGIPSFDSLLEYLEKAGQALELAEPPPAPAAPASPPPARAAPRAPPAPRRAAARSLIASASADQVSCVLCQSAHTLSQCPTYRDRTPRDRFVVVKEHNLCVNCLRSGHIVKNCSSRSRCFKCNAPHHTTIHFDHNSERSNDAGAGNSATTSSLNKNSSPSSSSNVEQTPPPVSLVAGAVSSQHASFLATASIEVLDNLGNIRKIRVVIDSGSQLNFITNKCARRLGLPLRKAETSIEGIGQSSSIATNSTVYRIRGTQHCVFDVESLAIPKICSELPCGKIDIAKWPQLQSLSLADPNFNVPGPIDALLGVDIFCQVLLNERLECGPDGPTAFNTKLGWIVMGRVLNASSVPSTSLVCSLQSLDRQIRKFWEVDDLPKSSTLSEEDALCEKIFASTHTRDENGRYVVRLPLKTSNPTFGDSYSLSHRRLLSLERRLSRDPQLREDYNAFMKDYLDAKHMELTTDPRTDRTYYIPHHCVLKPSSTTTRLRTVFDATAKPPGGASLNEELLIGPKLQSDIGSILLRFRIHSVVFSADIRQMYRQILVAPSDRDYQRILFRFSPNEPIREYKLNTVTYGMASSSFLALRTIFQVAEDETKDRPLAAIALAKDVYVDDVVTGESSISRARELKTQIVETLKAGCFELRKWASNCPALLADVPPEHRQDQAMSFDSEHDSPVKVLGLEWKPSLDVFSFSTSQRHDTCTKRNVLSDLARIFDPLGFLTPLTFAFKRIVQELWSLGLDWDKLAPDNITNAWHRYRSDSELLSTLDLPRFVPAVDARSVEIHGYCDASESGYAAVIYFRVTHSNGGVTTHLIMSRSKVASPKRTSIPRLELCAAVLLSDLVKHVMRVFAGIVEFDNIYCWSDSTVTLAWLRSPSSRWKTYVSNRVSHIQDIVPSNHWHHVRSEHNPADCGSRGLSVGDLINHPLWWTGPEWLTDRHENWPSLPAQTENSDGALIEQRREVSLFVNTNELEDFLHRYSNFGKVQRSAAYIHRFVHNCRNPQNKRTGHLIASELHESLLTLVKIAQKSTFSLEIDKIKKGLTLPKPFRKLHPFIDSDGLVRVGGRLVHSELDYDCKHPLLLPRKHRLTDLIIDKYHVDNKHPGLRTLHFLLAQNFWILASRRAINSRLSKCVKCFRTNPKPITPKMADLPHLRVSQVKPFSCVGVDFAGPFTTNIQRYRGSRTFKTYVCIFVCFATKAVHIELVSGLSSEAFLAALRRFIARRGRCQKVFCDRGTNFVGAYNTLLPLMRDATASEAIEFSFNPPAASHFGGLWEINVKSFKTHLYRTIGNQILTYEELLTLIVQIEALLNSRPLCEMSSDPNDMSVLTPGHFLTLEPLTSLPDPRQVDTNSSCISRWHLLQRLHRDFWKRWHVEYLHTLNQRAKWHTDATEPKVGSLVLIKDDQVKPLYWSLGRIVQLHPGRDGISRVATVCTKSGQLQRPLVKLCPLPLD